MRTDRAFLVRLKKRKYGRKKEIFETKTNLNSKSIQKLLKFFKIQNFFAF